MTTIPGLTLWNVSVFDLYDYAIDRLPVLELGDGNDLTPIQFNTHSTPRLVQVGYCFACASEVTNHVREWESHITNAWRLKMWLEGRSLKWPTSLNEDWCDARGKLWEQMMRAIKPVMIGGSTGIVGSFAKNYMFGKLKQGPNSRLAIVYQSGPNYNIPPKMKADPNIFDTDSRIEQYYGPSYTDTIRAVGDAARAVENYVLQTLGLDWGFFQSIQPRGREIIPDITGYY